MYKVIRQWLYYDYRNCTLQSGFKCDHVKGIIAFRISVIPETLNIPGQKQILFTNYKSMSEKSSTCPTMNMSEYIEYIRCIKMHVAVSNVTISPLQL